MPKNDQCNEQIDGHIEASWLRAKRTLRAAPTGKRTPRAT